MLGWHFMKVEPTEYVMHYRKGKLIRQGSGISFFYFAPTSSLILIPLTSTEVDFTFMGTTADFQPTTISGQVTYRVADPIKLSQLMNFTVATTRKSFQSDDPQKLSKRVVNHAQILARSYIKSITLNELLKDTNHLSEFLFRNLDNAKVIGSLGIEILNSSIFTIKTTQDIAYELEAESRENIKKKADEAVYSRKRYAIEYERVIKKAEIDTEIALLRKRKEVEEAQIETQIALEAKKRELINLASQNNNLEADAKAYALSALMKSLALSDPRLIQSLTCTGMDSDKLVALAFKELAEGAQKIKHFNFSSDILRELIPKNGRHSTSNG